MRKVRFEINLLPYEAEQWYVKHNYFTVLYRRLPTVK